MTKTLETNAGTGDAEFAQIRNSKSSADHRIAYSLYGFMTDGTMDFMRAAEAHDIDMALLFEFMTDYYQRTTDKIIAFQKLFQDLEEMYCQVQKNVLQFRAETYSTSNTSAVLETEVHRQNRRRKEVNQFIKKKAELNVFREEIKQCFQQELQEFHKIIFYCRLERPLSCHDNNCLNNHAVRTTAPVDLNGYYVPNLQSYLPYCRSRAGIDITRLSSNEQSLIPWFFTSDVVGGYVFMKMETRRPLFAPETRCFVTINYNTIYQAPRKASYVLSQDSVYRNVFFLRKDEVLSSDAPNCPGKETCQIKEFVQRSKHRKCARNTNKGNTSFRLRGKTRTSKIVSAGKSEKEV